MTLKFFRIPLHGGQPEEELNRLLASDRVREFEKHLVREGSTHHWAVVVTLVAGDPTKRPQFPGGKKIDYKEVLPPDEFTVYDKLRVLRKKLASDRAIGAYVVATNEQLAAMVQRRVATPSEFAAIEGIGPARAEQYGAAFLEILKEEIPKLTRRPASHDAS